MTTWESRTGCDPASWPIRAGCSLPSARSRRAGGVPCRPVRRELSVASGIERDAAAGFRTDADHSHNLLDECHRGGTCAARPPFCSSLASLDFRHVCLRPPVPGMGAQRLLWAPWLSRLHRSSSRVLLPGRECLKIRRLSSLGSIAKMANVQVKVAKEPDEWEFALSTGDARASATITVVGRASCPVTVAGGTPPMVHRVAPATPVIA